MCAGYDYGLTGPGVSTSGVLIKPLVVVRGRGESEIERDFKLQERRSF